jgi:hypothetical protein
VVATTANIYSPLGLRKARDDLRRAARGSDLVLAQEMARRSRADLARIDPPGWHFWQPAHGNCREVTVHWSPAWRQLRHYALLLARWDGRSGDRCAAIAILQHRATGRRLAAVSVHMLPHVELAGRPRPGMAAATANYARSMARLTERLAGLRARYPLVLVGGDWNVDYFADRRVRWPGFPFAHLAARMDTHWAPKLRLGLAAPTLGPRRVDSIWWAERRHLRALSSSTIRGTWSDHNFARVVLRLR